jgi:hypothetical protein
MRRSLADVVPNPIARVMCWAGLHPQHGWRSCALGLKDDCIGDAITRHGPP